jgi:hypothetical protein
LKQQSILGLTLKNSKKIMKKSLALAALVLGLGTSVFAATPAKSKAHKAADEVSFTSLPSNKGFAVKVSKEDAGKSMFIVYDADNNVVFKDVLAKGTEGEKGYILTGLDYGDYTVEVASKDNTVKKHIHVYEDDGAKSYFFMQE